MKPALFTSNKELRRAENIAALFDFYNEDKMFVRTHPGKHDERLSSTKYGIRVCDEFIGASPGKAIMIGHGLAGAKTYGLDQPYPYHAESRGGLLTWVITTSEEMIPVTARQSGVPESRVLPLGMPRTDLYFGKKKGDGGTQFGNVRMYLYAPTFRNWNEGRMNDIDWRKLDGMLTDGEMFVVKPHMVTKTILDGPTGTYKHIVEMPSCLPSTPYLIDCDVLVTDYSSIMLDAHVLGKPVVLFEKETGYTRSRGMYLRYPDEYASRYCQTERELVDLLRSAHAPQAADRRCLELTAGACDGHSRARIAKLIKETI